uniref:Ectoine hydroxylase n=1 Tax=Candidatus Kentrum sp. LFY TaxID=2126342 RepID=A0A450WNT7_9GAMM|nr:MAG: ectoine hydroxylase [Candidatus Kentron sp. LFY]
MLKLTERIEPVVWSKGIHTPLNARQLDDYERQGYLFIEDFFAIQEVDDLNERTRMIADRRPENAIFESQDGELRFLLGIHNDDLFKKYARNRFIVDAARQILDADVYIYQSKVVPKGAFLGKEIPFHSDYDVWHHVDGLPAPRIMNAAIFLTDQEIFNGALMVVPGSHKYFLRVHRHRIPGDKDKFHIADLRRRRQDRIDREEFRMIVKQNGFDCLTGPKGSILFWDANLIHGSTNNISPFERSMLYFTYNRITNKPANPVRPGFMVDRDHEVIG